MSLPRLSGYDAWKLACPPEPPAICARCEQPWHDEDRELCDECELAELVDAVDAFETGLCDLLGVP